MIHPREFLTIAERLDQVLILSQSSKFEDPLDALESAAEKIGQSWSKSWLGYQANVYYEHFAVPPAGARFSQEWGFAETYASPGTQGNWREYAPADVVAHIGNLAGNPNTKAQQKECLACVEVYDEAKSEVLSLLSIILEDRKSDKFLFDLKEKVEKIRVYSPSAIVDSLVPNSQFISRDRAAIEKGIVTPPHISVIAKVRSLRSPFEAAETLSRICKRVASHMTNQLKRHERDSRIGTNVFIGHGRSNAWRDLKDFLQDRLSLPWDEFNRIPIAGVTNIARLSQMLDESAIAFLVMTAEDEQADGKMHSRMNVIHEAGLFQGRLGFERAIVLLEDGCEEFSNIQGLGQIRFPKGNIKAVFEDIRQILEREKILS